MSCNQMQIKPIPLLLEKAFFKDDKRLSLGLTN